MGTRWARCRLLSGQCAFLMQLLASLQFVGPLGVLQSTIAFSCLWRPRCAPTRHGMPLQTMVPVTSKARRPRASKRLRESTVDGVLEASGTRTTSSNTSASSRLKASFVTVTRPLSCDRIESDTSFWKFRRWLLQWWQCRRRRRRCGGHTVCGGCGPSNRDIGGGRGSCTGSRNESRFIRLFCWV